MPIGAPIAQRFKQVLYRLLRRVFSMVRTLAARLGFEVEVKPIASLESRKNIFIHPVTALIYGMSFRQPLTIVIVGAGYVARENNSRLDTFGGMLVDPGLEVVVNAPHRIDQCVLVEPLVERLDTLREIVPHEVRTNFVSSAVGTRVGPLSLWVISPSMQDRVRRIEEQNGLVSSGGLGWTSSNRNHVIRLLQSVVRYSLGDEDSVVLRRTVDCVTLTHVLAEAEVKKVDYLQIDVEGLDADVIDSLDLTRFRPTVICFESAHLSSEDLDRTLANLRLYGYEELEGISDIDTVVALRGPSEDSAVENLRPLR